MMTTHKALHPGNYIDTVYVSRKKKVAEKLASIKDSVYASIQELQDHKKKNVLLQQLVTAVTT